MQIQTFFKAHWKTGLAYLLIILIGGLFGILDLRAGNLSRPPAPFLNSTLGVLMLFGIILTGMIKIAYLKPHGWLWLATSLYFLCYTAKGLSAWILLGFAISCICTCHRWKNINRSKKKA